MGLHTVGEPATHSCPDTAKRYPRPMGDSAGCDVRNPPGRLVTRSDRTVLFTSYGAPSAFPIVFQSGSPGTRWKRPEVGRAAHAAGVLLVVPDRPGYGGSTRLSDRSVADAAGDVAELADLHGWSSFGIAGSSGGGPHALACAALLPDRVVRCAVSACISPPDTSGREPREDETDPRRNPTSWLAAHDPARLRAEIVETGQRFLAAAEAGGLEFPGDPSRAIDDADAMTRLRATFIDSVDGWLDDNIAFASPWGFELSTITVPVSLRFGAVDDRSRFYVSVLKAILPTALVHETDGGHIQGEAALTQLLAWVHRG